MIIAIILAAGVGSRLKGTTEKIPKSLLKVANKEILSYQIEGLKKSGVDDIYIVTGYKSDQIKKYCNENYPFVQIIENNQFSTTNNMFSLELALQKVKDKDFDSLLVNNADCIYDNQIFESLIKDARENLIAGKSNKYDEESMKAIVGEQGRMLSISKQVDKKTSHGVTLDLYKMNKEVSLFLHKKIKHILEFDGNNLWSEVALDRIFREKEFYFFETGELKWIEIDNAYDYVQSLKLFTHEIILDKKVGIFDIDGTLFIKNTPIKENIGIFQKFYKNNSYYIVSNNTSKVKDDYVSKFYNNTKIEIDKNNIITPLEPTIKFINDNHIKKICILANKKVKEYIISKTGVAEDNKAPDAALLCYDNSITYESLSTFCEVLQKHPQTKYFATHPDQTCPTDFGYIPDIGSFIKMIETATMRRPEIIFGKPNKFMIEFLDIEKDKVVFFGDRIYTDFYFSKNCNIDFVLCLSGETTEQDVIDIIESGEIENIPQFIL